MEHYYVVSGNEYGVDLDTKKNFTNLEDAKIYFEKIKFDDFACKVVFVNQNGIEKDIEVFFDD